MIIRDCMKRNVFSINQTTSVADATKVFIDKHIGTLPVVDDEMKLIGILQLRDLLALVMPDFIPLVEDFEFVHDFGAVELRKPELEDITQSVSEIMQPPLFVEETCGVMRAFSLLHHRQLYDIPVVDEYETLVGIASRVDVGIAFLNGWDDNSGEV